MHKNILVIRIVAAVQSCLLLLVYSLTSSRKAAAENGAVPAAPPKASAFHADQADTNNRTDFEFREVENGAFRVGERLEYSIRYGALSAGKARLSIPEIVNYNGRPCYHLLSEAWSNPLFSRFYKVEDRVRSFTDAEGIFSWRMEKKQHEGGFRDERVVEFDQAAGLAITTKKDRRDSTEIPPFALDVLSAVYYVRTQNLAIGDSVFFDNYDNGKIYPLKIIVHRKEKIRTPAGKFECLVVEPFLQTPAFFQQKGRVILHMTADARKIPVLITSQLYLKGFDLGNIVAELEKMEGVLPAGK